MTMLASGVALVGAGTWAFASGTPAALAQAPTAGQDTPAYAAPRLGASDALYSRRQLVVSRDAARPAGPSAEATESAREEAAETLAGQRAEAREKALATMDNKAASFARTIAHQAWVLPVRHFHISTWFGEAGWYWSSGYHTGIDFVSGCGTPEVAVAAGRVARTGWDGPYGNQVRLRLANGDQVWYNHLTEIKTHVGAVIHQSQLIGLMGETGNAYGCHLHFEYRRQGSPKTPVNPAPYFLAHGINLHALQAQLAKRH